MNDDAAIEEINRLEAILYDLTDGITGTLQRDKFERLQSEIEHLRKEDAVWRQKYRLLESQFSNCHKEIFRLRDELLRYAPVEP